MAVLFDIELSPVYSLVNVEGALIFDEAAQSFEAEYIMVKEGYLEVGTEDEPFEGELTITMHGKEFGTTLPTFGNKVLAVKGGQLEMHGRPRSIAWTDLEVTVEKGSSRITVRKPEGKLFDWAVGDEIVIASTDFEASHAEKRTIENVLYDHTEFPELELGRALEHTHFAGVGEFGNDKIEIRAEVGLLTRSIKFRGDTEYSELHQYGAHIMLAPTEGNVVGRIENVELSNVGQASKLGRYPIHFHMAGNVRGSYIRNNVI
jgi:cell migration-inducing and hyaluronan-binding protein